MTELRPENNGDLQDDLMKYDNVRQNLKRLEILDYVKRDYPQYPWGLPTLDRRLRCFGIRYINYDTQSKKWKMLCRKKLMGQGDFSATRGRLSPDGLARKALRIAPLSNSFSSTFSVEKLTHSEF